MKTTKKTTKRTSKKTTTQKATTNKAITIFTVSLLTTALSACQHSIYDEPHSSNSPKQAQPQSLSESQSSHTTLPSGQEVVSGQLIVAFKEGTSTQEVQSIAKKYGMKIKQRMGIINGYLFDSDKDVANLQKTMKQLNQEPLVKYAEYNGIAHASGGNMGINVH